MNKEVSTAVMAGSAALIEEMREEIRHLPRYNAGLSADFVRQHFRVAQIAKLGSNENPYGPSPKVIDAIANAGNEIFLYPEASCDPLRAVLAPLLGMAPERLIFGNGSEDLIAVISHTFLTAGDEVITFAPSFGLHVIWPQSVGARVTAVPVDANYLVPMDEVLAAITPNTRLVMFGNPSNPVGSSITANDLRRLLRHLNPSTLLVFDEAYLEYAKASGAYPDFLSVLESEARTPWLLLRTMSKAYGLAGARIGYAVGSDPELIGFMDRVRAPFNVNRLAQVAATAALTDMAHVNDCVSKTVAERERVRAELIALSFQVAPSIANFLFVKAHEDAEELSAKLLTRGVIVKPWREVRYRDHIRVSVGLPSANDQFLAAWKALAIHT